MDSIAQAMLDCIKGEICGREEPGGGLAIPEISARFLSELYKLSKAHDAAHLVGDALSKNGLLTDLPDGLGEHERIEIEAIKAKFEKQVFMAIYRYENLNYELERVKQTLNEMKIPFLPLKGSVIRHFYPEPWMRTSCDIDILIKESDADQASKLLAERLQYAIKGRGSHDISLFSPSGIHSELHFKLLDLDFKQVQALGDIWNGGEIVPVSASEYRMSNELFLLYHIYHMAKHFVYGGCGIKPFIDLWVIRNKIGYDEEKAEKLLQDSDLLLFYNHANDLRNVWFEAKPHNAVTQEMENYILQGGVYGSLEQKLAMSQNKKGGKLGHLFSKIFLSYKAMEVYDPSLKKYPIFFPFYQVRRWFRIIFCGGRRNAMNEIRINQNLSEEKKKIAKNLMDELGL